MQKQKKILNKLAIIIAFIFFHSMLFAQDTISLKEEACDISINLDDRLFKEASGIQISNNSDTNIALIFSFEKNGFYDEKTLIEKIMSGLSLLNDTPSKQLLILDNIASIIKSDNFRNYNLLFISNEEETVRKMYSPMLMISSFYDMQCHHFQRLAAQMAFLTSYFYPEDFYSYSIQKHSVLGVKIKDKYIFHDYDPGQPGFRFSIKENDTTWFSLHELLENPELINAKHFYKFNNKQLCPWIGYDYYKSTFSKLLWQNHYHNINNVYGFIPQWILPPETQIHIFFPIEDEFLNFGVKVQFDKKNYEVRSIFLAYENYLTTQTPDDSLKTISLLKEFLNMQYNFNYDINYMYLLRNGLFTMGDTSQIIEIMKEHHIKIDIKTGKDTLFFLNDFLIPLPLHKIHIKKGSMYFKEKLYLEHNEQWIDYLVNDSLMFDLYNTMPPIFTSDSIRKPYLYDKNSFIIGPLNGYISPETDATLYYYYNPFYYRFHDLSFQIKYLTPCKYQINIKADK